MPLPRLEGKELEKILAEMKQNRWEEAVNHAKKRSQLEELRRYIQDLSVDGWRNGPDPWPMSWGFIDLKKRRSLHKQYWWRANHIEVEITTDSSEAPLDAEDWERPVHKDTGRSRVPRVHRSDKKSLARANAEEDQEDTGKD